MQKSQFLHVCHLNARSSELDLAQAKFLRSGTWMLA